MNETPEVLIGLGSNLPWHEQSSQALIASAIRRLAEYAAGDVRCSRLYRTSPVDCPPGSGDFVNAAMAFSALPGLEPLELLDAAKAIEGEYGRDPSAERNSPRALDLDLLAFGNVEMRSERLTLPHPRAWQRAFVLVPLNDVAPDFLWPGKGLTVNQLLDRLDSDEIVEPLPALTAQP